MGVSSSSVWVIAHLNSKPTPTSDDACGEVTGCNTCNQELSRCSTRGRSQGMYITFTSAKQVNKAEPTLALKPRGDVTRNQKQGYQWPQNRTHVSVKNLKENCDG